MGLTEQFEHTSFQEVMNRVLEICQQRKISSGIHVVQPDPDELWFRIDEGPLFIAYSIDSVFLVKGSQSPNEK